MLLSDTVAKPIFEVAASIYKFLYMLKAMFLYWRKFMGLIISTFTWTFFFLTFEFYWKFMTSI